MPSLQAMHFKVWNAMCAGIAPEAINTLHGDFDGDESPHLVYHMELPRR